MSQFWCGHWVEDTFKPKRLRNWEVPNWHPPWPVRHCVTTTVIADDRGYILSPQRKSKDSPWGNFKGTWDLSRRITRCLAEKLSAPPQSKTNNWEFYKKKHKRFCRILPKQRDKRDREIKTANDKQVKDAMIDMYKNSIEKKRETKDAAISICTNDIKLSQQEGKK